MKKTLTLLLAIVMMLSLCGCNSSDYKKAVSLYEAGNYAEAAEIFTSLGDYEDAAEMSVKCEYALAVDLLADGDYASALDVFAALGDYADSIKYSKQAKWGMLYNYVQENGTPNSTGIYEISIGTNSDKYRDDLTLSANSPEDFTLFSAYKSIEAYEAYLEGKAIDFPLSIDSNIVSWNGLYAFSFLYNSKLVQNTYLATGTLDISVCTSDTKLEIETYEEDIVDANGNEKHLTGEEDLLLDIMLNAQWDTMMTKLPELLAETGLPITVADLGFTAMQ